MGKYNWLKYTNGINIIHCNSSNVFLFVKQGKFFSLLPQDKRCIDTLTNCSTTKHISSVEIPTKSSNGLNVHRFFIGQLSPIWYFIAVAQHAIAITIERYFLSIYLSGSGASFEYTLTLFVDSLQLLRFFNATTQSIPSKTISITNGIYLQNRHCTRKKNIKMLLLK